MVAVEAEITAQRGEIRRFKRSLYRGLVAQIAVDSTDGAVDQHGRVIGLHGIATRNITEFLLKRGDKCLACLALEIRRPISCGDKALCRVFLRRKGGFIR